MLYKNFDRIKLIYALKCVDKAVLVNTEVTDDKMLALNEFHFDVFSLEMIENGANII